MPAKRPNGEGTGADPFAALAEALAPHLVRHLQLPAERAFYSQHDSPLGRRQHLELARSGAIESYKVGRLVLVRRDELHRFIESRATTSSRIKETEDDVLAAWDLEPEGA